MHRTIVTAACGTLLSILAAAAPLAAQDAAAAAPQTSWQTWEEAIDGFFARLEAGDAEKAVDQLYEGYPYLSKVAAQVSELKTNFAGLSEAVGDFQGKQRLAVQPLSDRFVYVWYIAFFDRQPLQFHFSFYKPKDRWQIYQFSYDQGVVDVAREMARRQLAGDQPPSP
jgi:hypothetical protein